LEYRRCSNEKRNDLHSCICQSFKDLFIALMTLAHVRFNEQYAGGEMNLRKLDPAEGGEGKVTSGRMAEERGMDRDMRRTLFESQ
jgi:hypothetical protein